jgi:hypothetical protein
MKPETMRFCERVTKGIPCGPNLSLQGVDDVDVAADARDSSVFESEWLRLRDLIDAVLAASPMAADFEKALLDAREASFKQAFNRMRSSDIAAFVSDDVELLGQALELGKLRAAAWFVNVGKPVEQERGRMVKLWREAVG